ncbi:hypothetical protein DQ384_21900 [Sphaerisporangium album]|uniref:Bro-N domain-containing protein n=1 Tax=Sphaerisporangium album TaxID=509200 RepID=A0A367FH24_9ACTN|nr:phage antirepressor KilAC domain-containing protein [Sphaerisporangium album]RCG29007.1 hypothetical protein DQ384_21900 [Sphaerisporangium album]
MSELQRFVCPDTGQTIRAILLNGESWFVGRDAAEILGIADARASLNLLDDDEHDTVPVIDSMGRQQSTIVINEPGLYSLILRSRKPEAKAFKRWVTHEVLPAIRHTGSYTVQPQHVIPASYAEALELAARQAREIEAKQAKIAELEPEAARARQTMDADGLALVGTVAKRFGLREKALREFLFAEHVLIQTGSRRNEPMAMYVQAGYFEVKVALVNVDPDRAPLERSVTYVTPRGEAFIWRRLVAAGVRAGRMPPLRQMALITIEPAAD